MTALSGELARPLLRSSRLVANGKGEISMDHLTDRKIGIRPGVEISTSGREPLSVRPVRGETVEPARALPPRPLRPPFDFRRFLGRWSAPR